MENTTAGGAARDGTAGVPQQKSGLKLSNLKLADFSAPSKDPAPETPQEAKATLNTKTSAQNQQ